MNSKRALRALTLAGFLAATCLPALAAEAATAPAPGTAIQQGTHTKTATKHVSAAKKHTKTAKKAKKTVKTTRKDPKRAAKMKETAKKPMGAAKDAASNPTRR